MSLSEIEQILARLSADEELRARFVENPFALGRELGLTPTRTRQLRREAAARFDSFASTPHERRFVQVNKLLPLTHRVLRERFTNYFERYVAEHGPPALVRGIARKDKEAMLEVIVRRSVAVWWRRRAHEPVRYAVFAAPKLFGRRR